jgi:tetratricopeptide (TPR) repeat protein
MLKPRDEQKYQTGLRHLAGGNLASAETSLRGIAAAYPRFAEAQYNLGLVLRARRKLRPAAHCFRSAVRIAPELAEAHAALAAVLLATGPEAEAESHARTALALRPSLAAAGVLLGDALRAQARLGDAREAYEAGAPRGSWPTCRPLRPRLREPPRGRHPSWLHRL